jgi:hypothetical protein
MNYGIDLAQLLALGPTKLSVLFLYRRIFRDSSGRIFNVVSLSLAALVAMWTIAFFLTNTFQYTPISSMWAVPSQAHPTFSQSTQMYLAQSYADVALDVVIITIPIPISMSFLILAQVSFANTTKSGNSR